MASGYRDDLDAAQRRVAELEEELSAKSTELADRNAELDTLKRRTRWSRRSGMGWVWVAAALAVVLSVLLLATLSYAQGLIPARVELVLHNTPVPVHTVFAARGVPPEPEWTLEELVSMCRTGDETSCQKLAASDTTRKKRRTNEP